MVKRNRIIVQKAQVRRKFFRTRVLLAVHKVTHY
jgi:hypothetical protein